MDERFRTIPKGTDAPGLCRVRQSRQQESHIEERIEYLPDISKVIRSDEDVHELRVVDPRWRKVSCRFDSLRDPLLHLRRRLSKDWNDGGRDSAQSQEAPGHTNGEHPRRQRVPNGGVPACWLISAFLYPSSIPSRLSAISGMGVRSAKSTCQCETKRGRPLADEAQIKPHEQCLSRRVVYMGPSRPHALAAHGEKSGDCKEDGA